MAKTKKQPIYLTSVVALESGYALMASHLAAEKSEPTLTRIFYIDDGEWFWRCDVDDVAYGLAIIPPTGKRPRTVAVLGRTGVFVRAPAGADPTETRVSLDNDDFWTDLVVDGERLYACGTRRTVAEYAGGKWRRIDKRIRVTGDAADADLAAAAVASDGSLVVCGDAGWIHRWNGRDWTDLAAPTKASLSAVRCLADGTVIAGGDGLLVLRSSDGRWTSVELDVEDTIEGILETPHGVILLTAGQLLRLRGNVTEPILSAKDFKIAFADFDAYGEHVWIVGDGLALRWNGKQTRRFPCPENV